MRSHHKTIKKLRVRKLHHDGGKKHKMSKKMMKGGNKKKMNAAPRAPEDYKKFWDRSEKAVKYERTGHPSVGPEHLTVEHARAIRDTGVTPWQATGEIPPLEETHMRAPASPEPASPEPASPEPAAQSSDEDSDDMMEGVEETGDKDTLRQLINSQKHSLQMKDEQLKHQENHLYGLHNQLQQQDAHLQELHSHIEQLHEQHSMQQHDESKEIRCSRLEELFQQITRHLQEGPLTLQQLQDMPMARIIGTLGL